MKQQIYFWIIALIVTIGLSFYQNLTGPTHPKSGKVEFVGKEFKYKFNRSHSGESNHIVSIATNDHSISGLLKWKRYKTNDEWTLVPMTFKDGSLSAELPHQPPAGKLMYFVELHNAEKKLDVPDASPIVIRFRGDVPAWILIPHIFAIFGAMLLSTRTGLEFFSKKPTFKPYTFWTLGLLIAGGFIFGPLTQLYSFGALWTGVPFGFDLTDNKTLFALIGWIIATIQLYRSKSPKGWILFASFLMFVIFLIPHSVLGSELDYSKVGKM